MVVKKMKTVKRSQEFTRVQTNEVLRTPTKGMMALPRKWTDKKAWESRRRIEQPPPGGWPAPPAHWPDGVRVDIGKPVHWLPKGWGQGVKLTCIARLVAFVSPRGKCFYHRKDVEAIAGVQKNTSPDKLGQGALNWARRFRHLRGGRLTEKARACVAKGVNWKGQVPKVASDDKKMLNLLTKTEMSRATTSGADLHCAVISARRANHLRGVKGIVNVECLLRAGGAKPVWYVDEESVELYRAIGLNAKVGGKLTPARNLALEDAKKLRKPCVQLSDDISKWHFYIESAALAAARARHGTKDLKNGNAAAKKAKRLEVSPPAAARYLLGKMRASQEAARLGGCFPLGNAGMALDADPVSSTGFILGDFFVADLSPVRFDERLQLKEDYDFTCAHLQKHGSVYRCHRLLLQAEHETNEGGAVTTRDEHGEREREAIRLLRSKWPGVFSINGRRGDTQVVMTWKRRKTCDSATNGSVAKKPKLG